MKVLLLVLFVFISGCATRTKETDQLVRHKGRLPERINLSGVPYFNQKENHCGPATLAMVLKSKGISFNHAELEDMSMTKKAEGTFQTEMISTTRRKGLLPITVTSLSDVLKEVSEGHPVIVFQNLGMSLYPVWHYAVVTGYNLEGPDIILHSGETKFKKMDMRLFERSFILGGKWGLVILSPDQLSSTGTELKVAEAAAFLESIGKLPEAELAYQTMLTKWPRSLPALIGLGNISYQRKDFKKSVQQLRKAAHFHSTSALAWHNLAIAEESAGYLRRAKYSSQEALKLADKDLKTKFITSLGKLLK